MTVLDYILDGLEAELALQRELGVRSIACDRALLAPNAPHETPNAPHETPNAPHVAPPVAPREAPDASCYDFVFLHDRALSAEGVTMMAKIIGAMHKTAETAPIVFTGERPRAKVYIVLGGNALKKWFPGVAAGPGLWFQTPDAPNVLVTYSPAYILRFGEVTPAVMALKRAMWTSLKAVEQRVAGL